VEAFLVSSAVVGLAEIGDKTQILSLMLAARFQRPVPIILGILFATLANHAAAGLAGTLFGSVLSGPWMRCMVEPLRHRQTKGAETDMPGLPPPRHFPTLPTGDLGASSLQSLKNYDGFF
jgi:hypothetical protein